MSALILLVLVAVIFICICFLSVCLVARAAYFLNNGERKRVIRSGITGFVGISVIISICFMTAGGVRKAFWKVRLSDCTSNLVQIGQAIGRYRSAHSNFPSSLQDLTNTIISPKLFSCSSSGHKTGSLTNISDWTDYYYVSGLRTSDPPDCVITYCCSPDHLGGIALFLDGSECWYSQNELQALTNNFGITNQAVLSEIKSRVKIIRGTGQIGK